MKTMWKSGAVLAVVGLALAGCGGSGTPNSTEVQVSESANQGPGNGRYVVALGDSYISGEGGRRANNGLGDKPGYTVGSAGAVYGDGQGNEEIPGCHRSHTAMVNVQDGWNAKNLACSGATTKTFADPDGEYKPGLFGTVDGKQNQSQMLEQFAKTNDVGAVVISIGGNDMGFSKIIGACVGDFVLQNGEDCADDSTVTGYLSSSSKQKTQNNIAKAFTSVQTAMFNAGYKDKDWQLVYALPPSPLTKGDQATFPETEKGRITEGHCPFYNSAMTWANESLLPQLDQVMRNGLNQFITKNKQGKYGVTLMNNTDALDGHRLCQKPTDRNKTDMTGESMHPDFQTTGLHAEWANDLVLSDQLALVGTAAQEAVHPNYWGQKALTSCVRHAVNNAGTYDGKEIRCHREGNDLNQWGDPTMKIGKVSGLSVR
ncbi:MAG: hypothetical protein WAS05_08545 [Candidatus Nanopelagicales bacterium]